MVIENEAIVIMNYTLKNKDGEIIDTSVGKTPLEFIYGSKQIISGLETALAGKSAGDKLSAVIEPEDAYGNIKEEYIQTVAIDHFEDKSQVVIGAQFQIDGPQTAIARVVSVEDKSVTLDLNHPLAGETLYFDIEIINVKKAPN